MVAEIALSLVVLACAGILIRTLLSLRDADRVVDLEHMMSARFTLPPAYGNDDARLAFVTRYTERLQGHPAIAASAVASTAPFSGVPPRHELVLPNQPIGDPIGQQIRRVETAAPDRALPWLTIVGVKCAQLLPQDT